MCNATSAARRREPQHGARLGYEPIKVVNNLAAVTSNEPQLVANLLEPDDVAS